MLPRRESISARFQISKIPGHGAVLVNQKTSLDPGEPVISRNIGSRNVIKPRGRLLLGNRVSLATALRFLPFFSKCLRYKGLPSHFRETKALSGISKASSQLYAGTSDKAGGTSVRHDEGRRYYV
jgi:hypothetical protein